MGTRKTDELLAMFRMMEVAKDAIQKFEDGDVSVRDAIRMIRDAVMLVRAA
jgi:hypothetical protein